MDHEQSVRGNSNGGGLAARSQLGDPREGESGTPSHEPHTAWHARLAPTVVTQLTHPHSPHCVHSSPEAQGHPHASTPKRGGALSIVSTAWRTQPSSEQGTSFKFFRCREVRRESRGEALVEHGTLPRPQPPVCATGPGVWPLLDGGREGHTDRWPGPLTAFVLS